MTESGNSALEAPLIALGTAAAMGITMSGYLHRNETHHAVEYDKAVRQVGKFATWFLSGMNPKEWEVVHLTHHAFTDTELTAEEWSRRQDQYPGAPIEAFRDPHSPILEGHVDVLLKNAVMYGRTAKAVMPYLRQLEANGVPRHQWPEHLREVDLSEDWMDQHVYQRKMAGVLGLTAMGLTVAALTDLKTGIKVTALHIPLILGVGGVVNSFGHLGATKNTLEKARVFFGLQPAVPDENGSYASDFLHGLEGLTAGEARHGYHHEHPGDAFISSQTNVVRDPTGVAIDKLTTLKFRDRVLARLPLERVVQKAA